MGGMVTLLVVGAVVTRVVTPLVSCQEACRSCSEQGAPTAVLQVYCHMCEECRALRRAPGSGSITADNALVTAADWPPGCPTPPICEDTTCPPVTSCRPRNGGVPTPSGCPSPPYCDKAPTTSTCLPFGNCPPGNTRQPWYSSSAAGVSCPPTPPCVPRGTPAAPAPCWCAPACPTAPCPAQPTPVPWAPPQDFGYIYLGIPKKNKSNLRSGLSNLQILFGR